MGRITQQNISDYLLYLSTEYVPSRYGGDTRTLSSKTLRNIYITLARGYYRVFTGACGTDAGKLARTIADSAGSDQIQTPHVAETKQYRLKISGIIFMQQGENTCTHNVLTSILQATTNVINLLISFVQVK